MKRLVFVFLIEPARVWFYEKRPNGNGYNSRGQNRLRPLVIRLETERGRKKIHRDIRRALWMRSRIEFGEGDRLKKMPTIVHCNGSGRPREFHVFFAITKGTWYGRASGSEGLFPPEYFDLWAVLGSQIGLGRVVDHTIRHCLRSHTS